MKATHPLQAGKTILLRDDSYAGPLPDSSFYKSTKLFNEVKKRRILITVILSIDLVLMSGVVWFLAKFF